MEEVTSVGMSEMFDSYEEDTVRFLASLSQQLVSIQAPLTTPENRARMARDAEKLVDQADQTLRQMEMELKTLPSSARSTLNPRVKDYREQLRSKKLELKVATQQIQRDELLGGDVEDGLGSTSKEQRARLVDSTDKLRASSQKLEEAKRTVLETEEIGMDIMGDLRGQREVILRTRNNMGEISENFGSARRILVSMGRRITTNKLGTVAAVGILAVALILLVVIMLGGGGSGEDKKN